MINEVYRIGNLQSNDRAWTHHQQDRVYSIDGLSACISVGGGGVPNILDMKEETTKYKIRRLTERECFRLMDVPEDSIDKMVSNISGTQCYKLAGNSIVVSCLYHIFRKMFTETEFESTDGQLSLF